MFWRSYILLMIVVTIINTNAQNTAEHVPDNTSKYKWNGMHRSNSATNENIIIKDYQKNVIKIWSKWSKWTKCSRPCGGGVQIRARNCITANSSVSNISNLVTYNGNCTGLYKRYRLCNDKECQGYDKTENFRNKQCRSYDNTPFGGQYYEWREYLKADNECELNCIKKGTNFYAKLNDSVIDGTPCSKPFVYFSHHYKGRAICVEGICKAVHFKGAIRGATTDDSHHKCGSLLCRQIIEIYKEPNLPFGLFYIETIPIGAWNISISQIGPTKNRLVLRAPNNKFIIDGEQKILNDTTYVFTYHKNVFEYRRNTGGQEIISMKGFLSRPVDLMISVKDKNPGVKYSYYIPVSSGAIDDDDEYELDGEHQDYTDDIDDSDELLRSRAISKKKSKFTWKLIGFGPCNKSCGSGYQPPIFRCIRDIPNRFYTPKRCMHLEKPVFHELVYRCNTKNCPPSWQIENCVCKNGIVIQKAEIKCIQIVLNGTSIQVADNLCPINRPNDDVNCTCEKLEKLEKSKFHNRRSEDIQLQMNGIQGVINKKNTITENLIDETTQRHIKNITRIKKPGSWLMSEWNNYCSVDCGRGIEYRSIYCDRQSSTTEPCDTRITPDTTRFCESERYCNSGTWFTGRWSDCTGDCFNLTKKRQVICVIYDMIVEDTECTKFKKPESVKNCSLDEVHYCKPKWHYSEWTPCSRTCGSGIQRRIARCLEPNLKANMLKESKDCRYSERHSIFKTCNNEKCPDNTENRSDEIIDEDETPSELCTDVFANCNLIDKQRVCKLNYYFKNCCATCTQI